MDYENMYLICYKPKSFNGCHKEKFTENEAEAFAFKERVEKRGSKVLAIYAPNGYVCYDSRRKYHFDDR